MRGPTQLRLVHPAAVICRIVIAAALLGALPACDDLQSYEGTWQGPVADDPQLRQGYAPQQALTLFVANLDGSNAQMQVQLPGSAQRLPFEPIRRASADALGSMTLTGDALRSYLGFVRPPEGEPYLVVVTLFPQARIEARVIRGAEDTYGVFRLRRQ